MLFRKGFLDTGVERIVDQVVNPKLNSNFVPKIEEIAYKYLGIEKPVNRTSELEVDTVNHQQFLPNLELEQVSPDSEKCPSIEAPSPNARNQDILIDDRVDDIEEKMDDFESLAFEPIECKIVKDEIVDEDDDKMDICLGDSDDDMNKSNGFNFNSCDEVKSNLSSISGLTSNESIEDSCGAIANNPPATSKEVDASVECETTEIEKTPPITAEQNSTTPPPQPSPPEAAVQQFDAIEQPEEKPSIHYTNDVVENLEEVLSQVSSNSRLSIITNNNTNTRMDDGEDASNGLAASVGNGDKVEKESACPYGISEEAQMQRFYESSSSSNSLVIDTDNVSNDTNQCDKRDEFVTAFDIKKEEIKFEGTERKSFDIDLSEPKIIIDEKQPQNGDRIESQTLVKEEVAETLYAVVASSAETSKDANFKNEDVSSVSTADTNDAPTKLASAKNDSTSNDSKLRTEDSKGLDESSSTSSKHKGSKSSSSTSSSSHRNGAETDPKTESKQRSSLSSSRHRSHSDRSKRSHSSSHSSLSREKNKSSRDESEGKTRSDDRASKGHQKSSSSSTRTGNDTSRSSSSKSHKDKERSRSDKSHRHSLSSLCTNASQDKDYTSKHASKHSDNKKSRSDSHRSTHRETDDHASHKEKPMPRKRSRSKDSNDGSANPSNGLRGAFASTHSNITEQSTSTTTQESRTDQKSDDQSTTTTTTMTTQSSPVSANETAMEPLCSPTSLHATKIDPPITADDAEDEFVLTTQPVVVDQILSGHELNLESFIDENRDNPLISSIERTLQAKVKKPKMAANIHEARKLMKVRKKIDREEQKKMEQARVLAKQIMRSNLTTIADDSQGVELEFACMDSGTNAPGPSISSPVKFNSSKETVSNEKPSKSLPISSSSVRKVEEMVSNIDQPENNETDSMEFAGFSAENSEAANDVLQHFESMLQATFMSAQAKSKTQPKKPVNRSTRTNDSKPIPTDQLMEMMSSNEDNRQLFLENNKITESDSPLTTKPISIRKRKNTETSISPRETSSEIAADGSAGMASVVANVFITPKAESVSGRSGLFFYSIFPIRFQ